MLKKLTDKQRNALIIAAVLIVLVIAGFLYFYYSGKAKGKALGSVNTSTTPTDAAGNTLPASTPEINSLAAALYTDMKGLNANGHDDSLWSRWLILSDTDFIRVNNRFNEEYQKESGQTMKEWVESEGGWGWGYGSQWRAMRDAVISRMGKLNIK